jgi:membrane protein implicated in regulation of membrane protease activity
VETAFLVLGVLGVGLIVVALVFGELLDGLIDAVHLESSGGLLSTEVIGSFLGALGFGGWLLLRAGFSPGIATLGALSAGGVMGAAALAMSRSLLRMRTDATPRTSDLVGTIGTVVTRIPDDGLGEIAVTHAGHRVKLHARADAALSAGTAVVVVDVTSPTSVLVTEAGF